MPSSDYTLTSSVGECSSNPTSKTTAHLISVAKQRKNLKENEALLCFLLAISCSNG